ncbi:hypothetical protein BX070DRAFT_222207 [Coemansia spiralis]|nr:hypothetical protein BX070DRAFT_222207 [Coemansia spiralis]
MSSRALRRTKSPANRNKFNDIGVTGRKTGVRVAGDVRVDEDGLENVEEFYKQTSPQNIKGEAKSGVRPLGTRTLHTLLSPTPIRSIPSYDTLMGALDMPSADANMPAAHEAADTGVDSGNIMDDEEIVSPIQARAMRAHHFNAALVDDKVRTGANRRTTLAPSGRQRAQDAEWVRSPKKGRRVTMAFMEHEGRNGAVTTAVEYKEETESSGQKTDLGGGSIEERGGLSPEIGSSEAARDSFVPDDDAPGNAIEDAHDFGEVEMEEEEEEEEITEETAYSRDEDEDQEDDKSELPSAEDVAFSNPHEDIAPDGQNEEQDEPRNQQEAKDKKKGTAGPKINGQHKMGLEPEHPVRRSTRASVQPLAYWRNEHIEYEYESGPGTSAPVPKMKGVVRVRQTAEEKNNAKKRRVKRGAQHLPSLRGITRSELDPDDRNQFFYYDDENYGFPVNRDTTGKYGPKHPSQEKSSKSRDSNKRTIDIFDDDDDIPVDERPKVVIGPDGESEQKQEIVISRQSIEWSSLDTKGDRYKVGLGLFMEQPDGRVDASTGVLSIAVGGRKPPRNSSNKMLFYLVTSGQVEVCVHASKFKVGILGQFMIPKHNTYSITNVGTHPAQLYYVNICPPDANVSESNVDVQEEEDASEEFDSDVDAV